MPIGIVTKITVSVEKGHDPVLIARDCSEVAASAIVKILHDNFFDDLLYSA